MNYIKIFTILFFLIPINNAFSQNEEEILDFCEVAPEYSGGDEAMMKFIQENIIYPQEAMDNFKEGVVYVSFVVKKDGSINDVKVIRGVSESIDAEAIRVIKMMPNWISGKEAGQKVNVRFTIPIRFALG